MRHALLLMLFLCGAALAADSEVAAAKADERGYQEWRQTQNMDEPQAEQAVDETWFSEQLAMLRRRFPADTLAASFAAWRRQIRNDQPAAERWGNYDWMRRVEREAIKRNLTVDPTK